MTLEKLTFIYLIFCQLYTFYCLYTLRREQARQLRIILSLQLQCLALANAICPDREQTTGEVPQLGVLQ